MMKVVKNTELPNALIRAFERHFIFEWNENNHLWHIPFFIMNVINNIYHQYESVYVLKRFTNYLLGYLFKIKINEYALIIPCRKLEREEILFLVDDSLKKSKLYTLSFTVLFSGSEDKFIPNINIVKINIPKTFK